MLFLSDNGQCWPPNIVPPIKGQHPWTLHSINAQCDTDSVVSFSP